MFYNEFDKTVDYFYKCNTCGKLFISDNNGILARLLKKVKCPNCGSRDVRLTNIDRFIKKDF
mgnify:FL=1